MNLARRVFDHVSQLIGSRENPGGPAREAPGRAVAVCISPDNAFKYGSFYNEVVGNDGTPEVEL